MVFLVAVTLTLLPCLVTLSYKIEDLPDSNIVAELHLTSWSNLLGIFIFAQNKKLYFRPVLGNYILSNPKHHKDISANNPTNSDNKLDIAYTENPHPQKKMDHSNLSPKTEKTRNFESKIPEINFKIFQRLFLFKPLLLNLLKSIPHIICLKKISVKGNMGMSNPMQTGIFYGIQQIISSLMSNRINIEITPSFFPLSFNGKIEIKFRLYLIIFIFFISKFTIHLFYLKLRDKFEGTAFKQGKAVN